MKRYTIRLADDLAKKLEELAKANRRSMHAEVLYLIEQAVKKQK